MTTDADGLAAPPRPVAEALAVWSDQLLMEHLEQSTVERMEECLLDALGVAIAAVADPVAVSLRAYLTDAGPGPCTALGGGRRLSAADAAFFNASLMHALDYDDFGYGGHGTAFIIPSVLATMDASGPRYPQRPGLLVAYAAGMEVFGRLALVTDVERLHTSGWHPSSVFGLLGATVAVAKAAGYPADTIANALSVASSMGCGITANFGSMTKPLHAGLCCSDAIRAVALADAGVSGAPTALEAPQGFFEAVATRGGVACDRLVAELGRPHRMSFAPPAIKQFPCCGGNHRAIQALASAMERHDLALKDIEAVTAHVRPDLLHILRVDWPKDHYEAKFCLRFSLAATLAWGPPTLDTYTDEILGRPELLQAREKTIVVADGAGQRDTCELEIALRDGRTLRTSVEQPHGSVSDPMTREEVIAKFRNNVRGKLEPGKAEQLIRAVFSLHDDEGPFWASWKQLGRLED